LTFPQNVRHDVVVHDLITEARGDFIPNYALPERRKENLGDRVRN
jgi:hypothetical protein